MCKKLRYLTVVTLFVAVATGPIQASPYIRAAYWDGNYGTAWAGDGVAVRDALAAVGYEVLDAAALKAWMDDRIADRRLSVVVMCRDAVPDTVAEAQNTSCTIRQYLDAGGKVVWYSDIPFYYVTASGGTNTTWGDNGSINVLGFGGSTAPRDVGDTVTITEDGQRWGLVTPWSSTRPTLPTAWPNLTILAANNAGNASGWVAHYVAGDTFRGFVRIEDHTGGPVDMQNLIAVAEYAESMNAATAPQPDSGASDVRRDVVLSWAAGDSAVTHDVYFGASFDDVNAASRSNPLGVLLSQNQTGTTFDLPDILDFETTYYWRIDEVNGAPDFTVFKGDVWSFTAEPFTYSVANITATSNVVFDEGAGPQNTINGSGLNASDQHSTTSTDMWLAKPTADEPVWIQYEFDGIYKLYQMLVWNYNVQFELLLGFGIKDATIEYSENGVDWTTLGQVELARATAMETYAANTTIDMQGVAARFVRLHVNSGWGTMPQYGLSEVRFLHIPIHAREPQPADGAVGLSPAVELSWRTGREAAVHEVYLSTSKSEVESGTALLDTITASSYAPTGVEFGSRYYWKIDEVNDAEAVSTWAGPVWTFVTQEFAIVEGFESYTDDIDAGEAIFDTWLDGWVNDTGSTVGYLETPFAERTIVQSGRQSMPLQYDNTTSPFYAETERTFETIQNWTVNGADTLRLFVAGRAPAFLETAAGTILMNAIGTDIWNNTDQLRYVYRTLSGNGSIVARIDYLDNSPDPWVKAGVMVRQNTEAGATNALIAMTGGDGGGATYQHRTTANGVSESWNTFTDGPFAPPYWIRVTREGNTLLGYTSPDGQNWTQRGEVVTIAMTDPVLIGLALTSHNANQATSAEFSNVSFTGNVGGSWQVAEIGVAQPAGNGIVPLYVAVEDASGGVAVVTHPDEMIVARSGWSEWAIPYSDLTGVDMSRVQTMYIGLGDRNAPSAGGSGLIYVDDIGYGKPFPGTEGTDITTTDDVVQGVPDDGDWPAAETPNLAIDNDPATKFLHFKGVTEPTGIRVTPSVGATVVTGLTLTTANDAPERDPVAFELYGSNDGIDGPYTLIATGDVPDFAAASAWPRFTRNATPIEFDNDVAYEHYQLLFTAVRDPGSANSMQIAEIELLAVTD